MFAELRELLRSGAIRRHQFGSKGILTLRYTVIQIWRMRQQKNKIIIKNCEI